MADAWGGGWGDRWGARWAAALAVIVPPLPYTLSLRDSGHFIALAATDVRDLDVRDSSHRVRLEDDGE